MEYEQIDKNSGDRTVMQVTEVDMNRSTTISTREYPVMGIKQLPEESEEEE
jgi:hypothetical protein